MQKSSDQDRLGEADLRAAEQLTDVYRKMTRELERVIIGQPEVLKQVMIALFCRGTASSKACPAWPRR